MSDFPKAESAEHLHELLRDLPSTPDDVDPMVAERLVNLAADRTRSRGDSAFEQQKDYIFTATWYNMLEDKLGTHDGRANEFALGRIDFPRSQEKNAWFVHDAVVPQRRWLDTGDDRMSIAVEVDLSDGEYHDTEGEMWWGPKGVNYVAVIEFADMLVKGDTDIAGAM